MVRLYFIAFFGVLCIAFDIAARRAYGVPRPWAGAAVRDLGPALYALLIIPFLVYMASYWSWFASETGINRHAEGRQIGVGGWMPDALRSLWYYTHSVYTFHSTLTNSNGNHHPWESKPWTWPMSLRPLLYAIEDKNIPGCGANSCVRAVLLVGTPAIWWLAVPVLLWATWATVVRRDWRYAAALVGYCAGWLPWFANIDRQMYFFYATPMVPFLVMMIAFIIGDFLHKPTDNPERKKLRMFIATFYLALVVTNFAWLYPILTGAAISPFMWNMEMWLPSWR